MKPLILALALISTAAFAKMPPGTSLAFDNKAELSQVKSGATTTTMRLRDRTPAPYSYVVGKVLPLVNENGTEDSRAEEDQVKAKAYGFVEFVQVRAAAISSLPAAEQAELRQKHSQEKIDAAKGFVTFVKFKFRAN